MQFTFGPEWRLFKFHYNKVFVLFHCTVFSETIYIRQRG